MHSDATDAGAASLGDGCGNVVARAGRAGCFHLDVPEFLINKLVAASMVVDSDGGFIQPDLQSFGEGSRND